MIQIAEFWALLDAALRDGSCRRVVLSTRRSETQNGTEKMTVRPTIVKGQRVYQWALRWGVRETHENLSAEDTLQRVRQLLGSAYSHGRLITSDAEFEVRVKPDGGFNVCRQRASNSSNASLQHNRPKKYLIPENVPCPFLAAIGVMTSQGVVHKARYAKFRQINRFLELVNDVLDHLPASGTLRVVDFGCGKSYLTFALYYLLSDLRRREVSIIGLDRKADVVRDCAALSKRLGCRGLEFSIGDIADHRIEGAVDLAVSLHACDTATDDAIVSAVNWQAAVILAVPCCQHELSQKINVPALAALSQQGILHEEFASLATDALRAQALEACGYKTQVVEFIELEHTPKNLLIRAMRRQGADRIDEAALAGYRAFKASLGLSTVAADRIIEAGRRRAGSSGQVPMAVE
jgi:SAM-dependent methyltransferase